MNLNKQLRILLSLEFFGNFRLAGGVWVLLLISRGFSLLQVGLAEAFFHVVSLLCEVPSGMLADILGRRKVLVASQCMFALSAGAMLISRSMGGVCLAMALSAMAYNLASGTREAITYESLLQSGKEGSYLRVSSLQNTLWRGAQALSTLCAGIALTLGYTRGYGVDFFLSLLAAGLTLRLSEPAVTPAQQVRGEQKLRDLPRLLKNCALSAYHFLKDHPSVRRLILFNALVGALATLLRFFLQDGLVRAGAPASLLGPLLLLVELGGVAGARLALPLSRFSYRTAGVLSTVGVTVGLLTPLSGSFLLMVAGGFLAVACDDALQTLTDNRLNQGLPSDQRATLVSVSSMVFSLVMIALSPLASWLVGSHF